MTVSRENSKQIYQGIKEASIRFITALPEPWLIYLLQIAEDDPEMCLVEVAKEEEVVVIAAPLKIVRGSGSPLRVLALVPGQGR